MKILISLAFIAFTLGAQALPLRNAEDCIRDLQQNGKFSNIFSFDQNPIRYGIFGNDTAKNGTILLLNGRGDYIEKYCDQILSLVENSYRVVASDWRGHGYSVRILPDPHKLHINNFDDYYKDLNFVANIVKKLPKPYYLIAYDLGGNIGLRYLARNHKIIDKAVFISPMWELKTNRLLRNLPEPIASILGKDEYILGQGDYNFDINYFPENLDTNDEARFKRNGDLYNYDDKFIVYGMTYGWLNESLKSFAMIRSETKQANITTPVLIMGAINDAQIPSKSFSEIQNLIPKAQYQEYNDAKHDLWNERPEISDDVHNRILEFIKTP